MNKNTNEQDIKDLLHMKIIKSRKTKASIIEIIRHLNAQIALKRELNHELG